MDGFSTLAPVLFRLGAAASASFPFGARIDAKTLRPLAAGVEPWGPAALQISTDPRRSHTLLIDVATASAEAHWVEPDVSLDEYPRGTLIIMQPAKALKKNAHYIVAVRRVRDEASGELIAPTPVMDEFLRGMGASERQKVYDKTILRTLLGRMGWAKHEIQLTWDFRTGSWEGGPGRVEHMIHDSQERLESGMTRPNFDIDDVVPETCDAVQEGSEGGRGREIWGTLDVPSYTTAPGPGHDLLRVLSWGVPICNGNVERVRFVSYIPCSVLTAARELGRPAARSVIQFGHGLLQTREEGLWEMRDRCETTQSLLWAIDWAGMSRFDLLPLMKVLMSDLGKFPYVPAQLSQGFANGACSLWYLRTLLRHHPSFTLSATTVTSTRGGGDGTNTFNNGQELIPVFSLESPIIFHGISLGGILGAAYVFSSPFIKRGILNVGGTPFGFILSRSTDFGVFEKILNTQVTRATHRRIGFSLLQTLWDPGESAGWLSV